MACHGHVSHSPSGNLWKIASKNGGTYIGNFIIPTDELHHFSEGLVYHQPVNDLYTWSMNVPWRAWPQCRPEQRYTGAIELASPAAWPEASQRWWRIHRTRREVNVDFWMLLYVSVYVLDIWYINVLMYICIIYIYIYDIYIYILVGGFKHEFCCSIIYDSVCICI